MEKNNDSFVSSPKKLTRNKPPSDINTTVTKGAWKKSKKSPMEENNDPKPMANKSFGKRKIANEKNRGTSELSDARLQAYGINPKKFKNRMKYGNKNE